MECLTRFTQSYLEDRPATRRQYLEFLRRYEGVQNPIQDLSELHDLFPDSPNIFDEALKHLTEFAPLAWSVEPRQFEGSPLDQPEIQKEEGVETHPDIKCVCNSMGYSNSGLLECNRCKTWQHGDCYYLSHESRPSLHAGINCLPRVVPARLLLGQLNANEHAPAKREIEAGELEAGSQQRYGRRSDITGRILSPAMVESPMVDAPVGVDEVIGHLEFDAIAKTSARINILNDRLPDSSAEPPLKTLETRRHVSRTDCGTCRAAKVKCDRDQPQCGRCGRLAINCTWPSPRARYGCLTCRKAKVKCAEDRPVCGRCVRLAITCEWLPKPQPRHISVWMKHKSNWRQGDVYARSGDAILIRDLRWCAQNTFSLQDREMDQLKLLCQGRFLDALDAPVGQHGITDLSQIELCTTASAGKDVEEAAGPDDMEEDELERFIRKMEEQVARREKEQGERAAKGNAEEEAKERAIAERLASFAKNCKKRLEQFHERIRVIEQLEEEHKNQLRENAANAAAGGKVKPVSYLVSKKVSDADNPPDVSSNDFSRNDMPADSYAYSSTHSSVPSVAGVGESAFDSPITEKAGEPSKLRRGRQVRGIRCAPCAVSRRKVFVLTGRACQLCGTLVS